MSMISKGYTQIQVGRPGYQGDFLSKIGGFLSKGLSAISGIGKVLPIPGAGVSSAVLGGLSKAIGGAVARPLPNPMDVIPILQGMKDPFRGTRLTNPPIPGTGGMTRAGRPRRIRKDGRPYKRPSMNPLNARAMNRAVRRLEKGEKLLRRVFSIRHGQGAGKILPKRKR